MHSRLHRLALSLAASGLLAACQALSPPPPRAAATSALEDLPTAWAGAVDIEARGSRTADAARLSTWWSAWPDPALAAWVTQALRHNTSIASAQASLRQARALREQAMAGDAVQVTLGGTAQASASRAAGSAALRQSAVGSSLDASWEPDLSGATRAAVRGDEAVEQAIRFSLTDTQVSVAAETALTYLQLRSLQTRHRLAQDNLASQRDTLKITEWRRQAGLASDLDVEQARAAMAQTGAGLPALATSLTQARHALAVLTGQMPAALDTLPALATTPSPAVGDLPVATEDLTLHIPADTLRQRPDVRQAEQAVLAAQARVDQAEAARRPSLRLSGDIGLSALNLGRLLSGPTLASTVLASLSVPVVDGGAAAAQVRAQQAALEQTRDAYRASILSAVQEVEDALAAVQGGQRQLAQWQAAAVAAGRAAELADQRYRSGLIDFQTVLSTQRSRLTAQDSEASAALTLANAQVRLYKALGGGWDPAAAAP